MECQSVLYHGKLRVKSSREVVTGKICKMPNGRIQVWLDNNWHPMSAFERIVK